MFLMYNKPSAFQKRFIAFRHNKKFHNIPITNMLLLCFCIHYKFAASERQMIFVLYKKSNFWFYLNSSLCFSCLKFFPWIQYLLIEKVWLKISGFFVLGVEARTAIILGKQSLVVCLCKINQGVAKVKESILQMRDLWIYW